MKKSPKSKPGIAIGIDFGTSYCCVGVLVSNEVEIMPNEQGFRTTPTYAYSSNLKYFIPSSRNFIEFIRKEKYGLGNYE
jgi:molecular chaperone DnaK (HSP70)